ncbi:hypothetical protein [Azospirillum argentinense]|uniref:hypothetical protein n=1 Tax=Azospirillum argentinense TaxID=2970906 RepID=UPI001FFE62F6|nr:hypothetical protein [Azospirillum argentinense]
MPAIHWATERPVHKPRSGGGSSRLSLRRRCWLASSSGLAPGLNWRWSLAVLDVDGVGGFSGKDVVLPLSQLHMSGDKIAVNMTKNQLQGLEKWQKDQYEDIKGALK